MRPGLLLRFRAVLRSVRTHKSGISGLNSSLTHRRHALPNWVRARRAHHACAVSPIFAGQAARSFRQPVFTTDRPASLTMDELRRKLAAISGVGEQLFGLLGAVREGCERTG